MTRVVWPQRFFVPSVPVPCLPKDAKARGLTIVISYTTKNYENQTGFLRNLTLLQNMARYLLLYK
jgi:hypothetical protein